MGSRVNEASSNDIIEDKVVAQVPIAWPQGLDYIYEPSYSSSITADLRTKLQLVTDDPAWPKISHSQHITSSSRVRITPLADTTHPACGQCGLFAARHLPAGSFILPYLGLFHTEVDADPTSDYDLSLDRSLGVSIDATACGNEARFINDYRGVPIPVGHLKGANAEFKDIALQLPDGTFHKCIGVFVLPAGKSGRRTAGIQMGTEILVSYGKGFWDSRNKENM